jgi:hypothetical protein
MIIKLLKIKATPYQLITKAIVVQKEIWECNTIYNSIGSDPGCASEAHVLQTLSAEITNGATGISWNF